MTGKIKIGSVLQSQTDDFTFVVVGLQFDWRYTLQPYCHAIKCAIELQNVDTVEYWLKHGWVKLIQEEKVAEVIVGSVLLSRNDTTFVVVSIIAPHYGNSGEIVLQPYRHAVKLPVESWHPDAIRSWVRDGLVRHIGVAVGYGRI